MTAQGADLAPADVAACDREPIRIPGSIQPHGVMLVLDGASLDVVAASANAARHLGQEAAGRSLSALLGGPAASAITAALGLASPAALPVALGADAARWIAITHRNAGLAFVELEPTPQAGAEGVLLQLTAATSALQTASTRVEACRRAAEAIRGITGFDRVMVYRFAPDWSGEVLAEARDAECDTYLGLHFPASDIPAQARALYLANPVRLIADVGYTPSPLVPACSPATGAPIDLSFATLRSVSPVHLEYLRNMGVRASMSVSVIRDGALWGLVACHHRRPCLVGYEARQACELVASVMSGQLAALDRVEGAASSAQVFALHAGLLQEAAAGHRFDEALVRQAPAILGLVDATGFALVGPSGVTRAGDVPDDRVLRGVAAQVQLPDGTGHFATDRLPALHPDLSAPDTAAGLLAVRLAPGQLLVWCRGEQAQSVRWAGAPAKAVRHEAGQPRLHPRLSFQAWTEEVRGRSTPWTTAQIGAALQLRTLLLELGAGERDALEGRNRTLVRSNRELETFIYVASHDIKEPLRQMEMMAGMIGSCARAEAAAEVREHLAEFRTLGNRLRHLTEELANYARPGHADTGLSPLALGDVAGEVLAQLRRRIEEADAEITLGELPCVLGERAQLHQVFVNLIGNALKYRDPSRKLLVSVAAGPVPQGSPSMVAVTIADNGIGFETKYDSQVFDPFVRLHSRDRYEGSGLGLAICRRVIERHGGRIDAEGKIGVGASFTLSLRSATGHRQAAP